MSSEISRAIYELSNETFTTNPFIAKDTWLYQVYWCNEPPHIIVLCRSYENKIKFAFAPKNWVVA